MNISQNRVNRPPSKKVKIQAFTASPQLQNFCSAKSPKLAIKVLPTKFFGHLNALISSTEYNNQAKFKERKGQNQDVKSTIQANESGGMQDTDDQKCKGHNKNMKMSQRKKTNKQFIIIQGNKVNGKLNGQAILETANGCLFKGQVQDGQLKVGTMVFPDGSNYQGQFKNGVFHGTGKWTSKKRNLYISTFFNGVMGKKGQIHYSNGDVYRGEIFNFKKHGQGELKLSNGHRYEGQFYEGDISGFGTYYANQVQIAKGRWKNGQLQQKMATQQVEGSISEAIKTQVV